MPPAFAMPTHTPRSLRAAVGALFGREKHTVAACLEAARQAGAEFPSSSVFAAAEGIGLLTVILAGAETIREAGGAYIRLAGLRCEGVEHTLAEFVHHQLVAGWMSRVGAIAGGPRLVRLTISRSEPAASAILAFDREGGATDYVEMTFGEPSEVGIEQVLVLRKPVIDALIDLLQATDLAALAYALKGRTP